MDITKYDEEFVEKFTEDAVNDYMYEPKTDEFKRGEIVGMQSVPSFCEGTTYVHDKDTTLEYTQLGSFISQEFSDECDLQIPICNNC